MTPAQYDRALERIEEENPGETLLPALRQGFSRVNALYMAAALRRVPTPAPASKKANATAWSDETLRGMWGERKRLFGEWATTANRFHECDSDAERALISDRVLAIWEEIQALKAKIAYYEEHRAVPAEGEEERFPLPDDPVLLLKKLHSIRAQISQEQAKLRDLAALPDEHPDKEDRIAAAEKRRAELILYRGHAEQKIAAAAALHE